MLDFTTIGIMAFVGAGTALIGAAATALFEYFIILRLIKQAQTKLESDILAHFQEAKAEMDAEAKAAEARGQEATKTLLLGALGAIDEKLAATRASFQSDLQEAIGQVMEAGPAVPTPAQARAENARQSKEEKENSRQAALWRAISLYKEGKDAVKAIQQTGLEYPGVAAEAATNPTAILKAAQRLGDAMPPELLKAFVPGGAAGAQEGAQGGDDLTWTKQHLR